MDAPLRHLCTLLIAVSLIMAPLGGVLAMAGLAGHDPATVHCPESGAPAEGLQAEPADTDAPQADGVCCDLPCLVKCGHGATALPAPAVMLVLPGATPARSAGDTLTDLSFPPAGHPPRVS